jgi:hypothetical protein
MIKANIINGSNRPPAESNLQQKVKSSGRKEAITPGAEPTRYPSPTPHPTTYSTAMYLQSPGETCSPKQAQNSHVCIEQLSADVDCCTKCFTTDPVIEIFVSLITYSIREKYICFFSTWQMLPNTCIRGVDRTLCFRRMGKRNSFFPKMTP